jgi:hypothetical protein
MVPHRPTGGDSAGGDDIDINFVDERHLTLARVSGREPPNDGHEVRFPTGIYNTLSTSSESLSKKRLLDDCNGFESQPLGHTGRVSLDVAK